MTEWGAGAPKRERGNANVTEWDAGAPERERGNAQCDRMGGWSA
ncbi:MAG TPA: hypothetical protein VK144_08355 [Bacillota bacterium]|nr:hypothetical protein [Bacillota bacterium]